MNEQTAATFSTVVRLSQLRPLARATADPYGFSDSAVDALMHHCRFTPAMLDGQLVPFLLLYTFVFMLPR